MSGKLNGVLVARWTGREGLADGIYWTGAGSPHSTLFDAMERYLTTGETLEIISYHGTIEEVDELVYQERKAHGEKP